MELRSCSHLHFIQAVKGDSVTKVLNVYRGRPALKFKVVKDLYDNDDAKDVDPVLAFRPKLEFVDFPIECDSSMDEHLCALTGERKTVKSEGETSDSSSQANNSGARKSDDLILDSLTLKQIKERCKKKKRKCFMNSGVSEEKETSSPKKQSHIGSLCKENEYDIMEPLSCWKSRILNKKKTKRKSSQNALSIIKFEEIPDDQVIFQSREKFPAPIAIKVEVPDHSYSDCKDLIVVAADSSFISNEPLSYGGMISYEEPETANDYVLKTETSRIAIEEPDTAQVCVLETGMSMMSSQELTTEAGRFDTQMQTSYSNGLLCCSVNEQCYEYVEPANSKSIIGGQASVGEIVIEGSDSLKGEIMMEGIAEVISHQFSELSLVSDVNKEFVMDPNPDSDFPETVSPNNYHGPIIYHDPKSLPCVHEKSQTISSDSPVQVPEVVDNNSFQYTELSKRKGSFLLDDEAKVDALYAEARIISRPARDFSSCQNSNPCLSPTISLNSDPHHSSIVEEGQSPLSIGSDAARNCSPEVQSCIDEPLISAKVEEVPCSKLQHPPERLLSSRKAISPTAQKRLCEALECNELDAEQYYKYARKLCYKKQTENKKGRPEGANHIRRAEVGISPKKMFKKSEVDNNGFHKNGKVSHPSRVVQHFSTGCTSIRSCSESAVLFSQQQMCDIESVTTKLAKELQFMRDIVEETFQSEVYTATPLKYSTEEIRIAVRNATRVEESARRSLSIMARDCNRFCKIMKLAEKGSAASPNVVRKKRTIVFADEAGGKLCDVKTFENDMSPFREPKGENIVTVD